MRNEIGYFVSAALPNDSRSAEKLLPLSFEEHPAIININPIDSLRHSR